MEHYLFGGSPSCKGQKVICISLITYLLISISIHKFDSNELKMSYNFFSVFFNCIVDRLLDEVFWFVDGILDTTDFFLPYCRT